MPDLRSWLERGGFLLLRPWSHGPRTASVHPGAYPKVDESLDGLGRMHSRLELHPRALSTEARHLVPRRRMGALGGARLVPRRLHLRRLPITRRRNDLSIVARSGFVGTTLRRACSREDPRAPDAFEDCVIRRILRFARHIAFRRALHRRGNRGIRRRK